MNNAERVYIARSLLAVADTLERGGQAFSVSAAKKLSKKAAKNMIANAYGKVGHGVQIDIMDIGKVFAEGEKALAADPSGATLEQALEGILKKIRKN